MTTATTSAQNITENTAKSTASSEDPFKKYVLEKMTAQQNLKNKGPIYILAIRRDTDDHLLSFQGIRLFEHARGEQDIIYHSSILFDEVIIAFSSPSARDNAKILAEKYKQYGIKTILSFDHTS